MATTATCLRPQARRARWRDDTRRHHGVHALMHDQPAAQGGQGRRVVQLGYRENFFDEVPATHDQRAAAGTQRAIQIG